MNAQRLLDRFLRYVQVDTTANENSETYPSSPGQMELGRMLVRELRDMGIADAVQDEHGIILATVPATLSASVPTIAFCAHLDTSAETTGKDVRPQVIRNYAGGDILLPADPTRTIRVTEHPELAGMLGKTLITSDGTTLLGADDKSGVAAIMEAVQWMMEHPESAHGPVRVCFTCDEELGRGVDHLDLERLGASVCYTLDGQGADELDVETFSADMATVSIEGVNIHPGVAKGRMVNAIRVAGSLIERLPRTRLSPETTEGREEFLHPYELSGGVAQARLRILLRSFETEKLSELADLLRTIAAATQQEFPGVKIDVSFKKQYRNMAEGLSKEPRAISCAERALGRLGRTARKTLVRGGTDGSRLTELGLPTPNLSTGEHSPHSPLEWSCLEEMVLAAEWIAEIAQVWGEEAAA